MHTKSLSLCVAMSVALGSTLLTVNSMAQSNFRDLDSAATRDAMQHARQTSDEARARGLVPHDASAKEVDPATRGAPTHWLGQGTGREPLWADPTRVLNVKEGARPSLAARESTRTIDASGKAVESGLSIFTDSSGQAVAMPGGVIVDLKPATRGDEDSERAQLVKDGLKPRHRLSDGRWVIESSQGEAALTLANQLAGSGRYASAVPDMWRAGRVLK